MLVAHALGSKMTGSCEVKLAQTHQVGLPLYFGAQDILGRASLQRQRDTTVAFVADFWVRMNMINELPSKLDELQALKMLDLSFGLKFLEVDECLTSA